MKRFKSLFLIFIVCTFSGTAELFELQKIAESKIPDSLIIPNLGSITIDSDGNVYAFAGRLNGNECFVVKFDSDLNYLLRLDTLRIYVMVGSSGIIGAKETYYGDNHFMEANESLVVFGNSQKYKFDVYDLDGKKILEIEDSTRKLATFKKNELNKIGERYARTKENNLPLYYEFMKQVKKRKNVIAAIKLDGENVFVFPLRKDITVENRYAVEIYNRQGEIFRKGFIDKIPDKIWNGFAFFIEYDDEFYPKVVKYKIIGR